MRLLKTLFLLLITTSVFAQGDMTQQYFRHLRYNHVSPYIEIVGIHPINQATAQSTSHYVFKYDQSGRLKEIINNHYHTEKQHPLASLGTYKTVFTYENGKEIREFYDPNGKRISNDRKVYKEEFHYDANNFKHQLKFYDLADKPMESNWKIAEYRWEKKAEMVVERRFNLQNEPVNVSPYFEFGITGIVLDKKGAPKAHYNLNDKLEVTENTQGLASYQDAFDAQGNHTVYSYHDSKNNLVLNQWKFAKGKKEYDSIGNHIKLAQLDTEGNVIRERPMYTNSSIKLSSTASQKDSMEVKRISLGYLIALQQLKPELMDEVMNDSLNKVTIGFDRKQRAEIARATTKKQMIEFATSWNKANNKFPTTPSNQVEILDIYNRIATVKLTSDNWVEYLHLIRLDKRWEIVNLIWQHKDVERYPKE